MHTRAVVLWIKKINTFFSVEGSHRRATKNHKSKAELLNQEEGEGDLAVGKIQIPPDSLSLLLPLLI